LQTDTCIYLLTVLTINVPPKTIKYKCHKNGTPTKRQVSKRQVSKRLVSNVRFQNVRFTKRQVYKTSGLHKVRSSKRPVAKKHPYKFCTCGWWKSTGSVSAFCLWMSQPVVMDVSACRISDF